MLRDWKVEAMEYAEVDKEAQKAAERRLRRNRLRRERDQCMRDLGLKKVRGSLGGTYWE